MNIPKHDIFTTATVLTPGLDAHAIEMGQTFYQDLDRPGACVIAPPNTWHTERTTSPCTMLFITPGEGTLSQEQPG